MSTKAIEAVAIALLAVCSAWAAVLVARVMRAPPAERTRRLPGALLWAGLCARGIAAWPAGVDAARFPVTTLWMAAPLLCVPWVVAEALPEGAAGRARAQRATGVLLRVLLGVLLLVAVGWLIAVRRAIGGVDFWFYICNARDLADGVPDPAGQRWGYFPGVYWFWRPALALTGRALPGLQWSYLGLLGANAALVAALVFRTTRSALWAAVAATWLLLLGGSLEALEGCTEPLAAAAALAGLLAWDGSRKGALLLGAGLGAALFARQQGGLLALGWLGLLIASAVSREGRGELRALLWVPLAATATTALGFALSGGLQALRIGLGLVARYQAQDHLARHLLRLFHQAPSLAIALPLAAAALVLPRESGDGEQTDRARRLLPAFTLVAALATLLQFEKRGYFHYALLTAPVAVVAAVTGASMIVRRCSALLAASPLLACSLAAVVAVEGALLVTRLDYLGPLLSGQPVEEHFNPSAATAADLAEAKTLLRPGEDLLLLAPSQNQIHFALGTRALSLPNRYGWPPGHPRMALEAAASPAMRSVLAPAQLGPDTAEACLGIGCEAALQALPSLGYRVVVQRPTLTLWQRP